MNHCRRRVTLRLLTGEPDEMAQLGRVLQGAPTYAQRVTGYPPGPADAQSLFSILPPGLGYDAKFSYGVMLRDGSAPSCPSPPLMVGCADVLRGWPDRSTALIGLLLLDEAHQRRGLGSAAYRLLEEGIRSWPEVERVRAAVVRTNSEVLPFWFRLGFVATGEVTPYRYDHLISEAVILTRTLPGAPVRAAGPAQPVADPGE